MQAHTIHPTAIVSQQARIGDNAVIGPFCIIHDGVEVGPNSEIDAYCELGIPSPLAHTGTLSIGSGSKIRSHATIYAGSVIGSEFTTGHYVTVRENSALGKGVQLGNRSDVQGDCTIGNFVKTHADVHIGKHSRIGNFVWLFPEVLLANDPTPPSDDLLGVHIGDYAVVASKCLIHPGVRIGRDAVVAAASVVKADVPDGKLALGNPAKHICDADVLRLRGDIRVRAYPWRYRFTRGYPEEMLELWQKELNQKSS